MARATLIHNAEAGDGRPTGGELRELVGQHGYCAVYATTDQDLDTILQDPGDLVVVAGGDGTVGHVAARLTGRDITLAILPIGTANNLASGLGITGPIDELVRGWTRARRRLLNVGTARGPWGERPFIESFGLGLFPHAIPLLSALKKGGDRPTAREAMIRQDRQDLRRLVDQFVPRHVDLCLDGDPAPGSYLMVEAMNAPMLGPRLPLAPAADPGDHRLQLVLVHEGDRKRLAHWLDQGADDDPGFDARAVSTIDILWDGQPLHIDGETWADASAAFRSVNVVELHQPTAVRVELEPQTVPLLVPSR
jgi:diacylglycerol kinase (ATP)